MTENQHERLIKVEDRTKSNTHRIEDLEKRADNTERLVESVARIAEKQSHMENDVKEMKTDVRKLVEKPAKRWDTAVEKIIYAVILAILGYFLAKAGL